MPFTVPVPLSGFFFNQQPVQVGITWNGWFLPKKMETDLWWKDYIKTFKSFGTQDVQRTIIFRVPGASYFFLGVGVGFTSFLLIPWIYETSNLSSWWAFGIVWEGFGIPNHQITKVFSGLRKSPKSSVEITPASIHFDVQLRFKGYKQLPPYNENPLPISKHHLRPPAIRTVSASSSVLGEGQFPTCGPGSFQHAVQWCFFLQAIWINRIAHKTGDI